MRMRERKFHQGQNLNQNYFRIRIWISGLIQIQMSAGSLPKCCGLINLSASIMSPSFVSVWEMLRSLLKSHIPHWCGTWKVIQNPHPASNQYQNLTTSRGSPLAHAYHVWWTSINELSICELSCWQTKRTTNSNYHITPPWRSKKTDDWPDVQYFCCTWSQQPTASQWWTLDPT